MSNIQDREISKDVQEEEKPSVGEQQPEPQCEALPVSSTQTQQLRMWPQYHWQTQSNADIVRHQVHLQTCKG